MQMFNIRFAMVPDMSAALASMPQGMAALDAARLFQLSIVTGPLLLSMSACFWKNAPAGKFGGVARHAALHEEELGLAYEAYFKENGINASVPVLVGTRHVPEAMAKVETTPTEVDVSSVSGAPASGPAQSRAKTKSRSSGRPKAKAKARAKAKVPKETAAKAKAKVPKETVSKSEAKVSKDKARKGKASAAEGPSEGTTLLNQ